MVSHFPFYEDPVAYRSSLETLAERGPRRLYMGHPYTHPNGTGRPDPHRRGRRGPFLDPIFPLEQAQAAFEAARDQQGGKIAIALR